LTTKLERSFVRVSALPLEKTAGDQQLTDVLVAKPADRAVSLVAQPTRS
jgi:hypothetical protein